MKLYMILIEMFQEENCEGPQFPTQRRTSRHDCVRILVNPNPGTYYRTQAEAEFTAEKIKKKFPDNVVRIEVIGE